MIDPAILERIGDAAVPQRGIAGHVLPPDSLPGVTGLRETVRSVIGPLRSGADFYARDRARYGEIYRGMFAGQPTVFVWHPEQVQKLLRNEDGAWSAGLGWSELVFSRMYPHAGNSGALIAMDFDAHRGARKLVQHAFTPRALKGYLELAAPRIDAALARWLRAGRVPFKAEARVLLSEVANEIFTGIGSLDERGRIDRAVMTSWRGVMALSTRAWLSPTLRHARRSYGFLLALFESMLPARREQPGRDLLSQLALGGAADGTDDAAIAKLLVSIMITAYDTTTMAVTSMAYLLAREPAWQQRLRDEARQVEVLDWEGLARLEQLEWAWKESLRLMPATGPVPRRTLRELELLGHHLQPGTFATVMIGPHGRSDAYWPNPLVFDPERFARGEDRARSGSFAPFGGGPHACIGQQLATLEAKLVFHRLLTRTRFALVRDNGLRHVYAPFGVAAGKVELALTPLASP
ncbi:MAG TPA: cytochrome P450 [Polyangiales bacterium]|nr:cytochrome P450 [Polyangiales bacterium]